MTKTIELTEIEITENAEFQSQWDTKPLEEYFPAFKDKHKIILKFIESRSPTTPIDELMRLYEEEMVKLKNEFRKQRVQEYRDKSITISRGHSCTNGVSGRVKDCGYKYIDAPTGGYTIRDWVRVDGTNKGVDFSSTRVGLRMTRAGKGRNYGTLIATFKYHPDYIFREVETDLDILLKKLHDKDKREKGLENREITFEIYQDEE